MNKFYFAISTDDNSQIGAFLNQLWVCPSANCTFPTYQSLAVQYQCTDLSSQVTSSGSSASHPSDSSLILGPNAAVNSSTIFSTPGSNLFSNPVGLLLGRWLVIGRSVGQSPASGLFASDCAFYWSVNTYKAHVTKSVFSENVVDTSLVYKTNGSAPLHGAPNVPYSYIFAPTSCYVNGNPVPSTNSSCQYTITGAAHEALINFFGMKSGFSLPGYASVMNNGGPNVTYEYSSGFMLYLLQAFQNANSTASYQQVAQIASQGAEMMTTVVRQQPIQGNSRSTYRYDIVPGTELFSGAVFMVLWPAMVYPGALVLFSTLFFIITAIKTRNENKWKNSLIAILFHGLTPNDIVRVGELSTYMEMTHAAKNMEVQLVSTQHGEKLMSRDKFVGGD
jgi:hypothetical protein